MKKLLLLALVLTLSFALTACGEKEEEMKEIPAEFAEINEVDEFLFREGVQYVDLRNFEDKMAAGYIEGFEMIPFFNYLEYENILVRTDKNWEFAAEDIVNEAKLKNLFDMDKTIILMCGSGTRAQFVMDALLSLGYTDVINAGGIGSYTGEFKVLGDNVYNLDVSKKGPYTPGTHYAMVGGYSAAITINSTGAIVNVWLDALNYADLLDADGNPYAVDAVKDGVKETITAAKRSLDFDSYPMNKDFATGEVKLNDDGTAKLTWWEMADKLGEAVVAAQGWSADWVIDASTTGGHDYFGADQDAVSGVTFGIENFKGAVEAALELAMGN